MTLNDVNQPQTISAPSNAKPLSDLQSQLGALGALGGLSGAGSSIPSIPSTGSPSGSSSSGLPSTPSSSSSQKYIQCALQAQGNQAAINKCAAEFLGQ